MDDEIIVIDKIIDTKRNFLHPVNFLKQGHERNIITQISGKPCIIQYPYDTLFQYLKKTKPKILLLRMGALVIAYQINVKIKEWTLDQFKSMFINNAGLSTDFVIDFDQLFDLLKTYKYSNLDELYGIREQLTTFTVRAVGIGGNKNRKKKTSKYKKKRNSRRIR
jgi:hypothetical protein